MNYNGHQIHTVWLDLDDTLIDFHANSLDALRSLWTSHPVLQRLFPDAESWTQAYLYHNHRLWALYNKAQITREHLKTMRFAQPLIDAGLSHDDALKESSIFDPLYLDLLAQGKKLVPGALDVLKHLRKIPSVNIGILSNGFLEVQYRKIESAGLTPYIDTVVLSDHIGINKPDTRLYKYAMEQVNCTDAEAHLMIGDNPDTDIAGAIAAGWQSIWYCPGPTTHPVEQKASVVTSLHQIIDILKE